MLRVLVSMLVFAAVLARPARAQDAAYRVVVEDRDPELRRALALALSPWRLGVVEGGEPPADLEAARARADAAHARFVVWRDGDALVVFDREREVSERRPSVAGPMAAAAAAAAALTVKTMMRLPPIVVEAPAVETPAVDAPAAVPAARDAWLRFELAGALRIASGDAGASARIAAAAMTRAGDSRWWLGALVEVGPSVAIDRASFKGDWSDQSILAIVGWQARTGGWQLVPRLGLGARLAALAGTEAGGSHDASSAALAGRGELVVRWGGARWTISAQVGIDAALGTRTYQRLDAPPVIFREPGVAARLALGVELAL